MVVRGVRVDGHVRFGRRNRGAHRGRDRQGAILSIAWNISDNLWPDEWTDPVSGDPAWLFEGAVSTKPVTDAALTIPLPPLPVSARPQQAGPPRRADPPGANGILAPGQRPRPPADRPHTGLTHTSVNAELNRITGVK